jgi:subtilisin family serine protease
MMRRTISTAALTLALATTVPISWAQTAPAGHVQERTGDEYVVAFAGSTADATAAIRDAGGIVLDVNEAVGAALVSSASLKVCNKQGKKCGFYTYYQGTSMAAPHVTGVIALIIEEHGKSGKGGKSLAPDIVRDILLSTAADHACPAGGVEDYGDEGRPAEFNAVCDGTTASNGLYGEGIVNALAAVAAVQ